ncbi:MAG: hypothetical protein Q9206_003672 [Seirophora lacunosa]
MLSSPSSTFSNSNKVIVNNNLNIIPTLMLNLPPINTHNNPLNRITLISSILSKEGSILIIILQLPAPYTRILTNLSLFNKAAITVGTLVTGRKIAQNQNESCQLVTKYAVPPHVQQAQNQPPYHYGAQYAAPSYPQYQAAPGPLTPMSGQSPSHQQWHQQPYPQQYQQSYPQQQQYAQPNQHAGYQQQPQPYVQTAPATPATPYGSQYAHTGSPQAAQANAVNYFQNSQYQQQPVSRAQSMTNASPISAVSQTAPYQQHHPVSNVAQAQSAITEGSVEPPEGDDEDEDLAKMDIPDIPPVIGGSFASLVDRPLPANFIVADALEPFDPPKPENDGRCQSKYVMIDSSSTFHLCIKDTKHWDDMKNDPVFRPVHESQKVIPLDIIMATYRPPDVKDEPGQVEVEEGEWTHHTGAHHDKGPDLMDQLEHALGAGHAAESSFSHNRTTSRDRTPRKKSFPFSKPTPPSEDAIASRAIDGPYRPHHHTVWPCPPPPAREESPIASPGRTPPLRSRTPSMYELAGTTAPDASATAPGESKKRSAKASLDPFEPPPPPAQIRKAASYDGADDDLSVARASNGHANENGRSHSNSRSYSNDFSGSPSRVQSDAINGRKRDYEQGAMSEEDNTPKRRQADDTKSKLKKRGQPKVAAAYR